MSGGPRRRQSLLALIAAAIHSLFIALGCGGAAVRPLAAPSPPMFLAAAPGRSIGPLRPATEAEISLVKKALPLGAVVNELFTMDADTAMRVTGARRAVDLRLTEHEHRRRSIRLVGPTAEGLFRYRVTYVEDVAKKVDKGRVLTENSPVHGRSYVIDVGPGGVRVFTADGYTPSPAEVLLVQKDYAAHTRKRPSEEGLRRAPRELAEPPPAPSPVAEVTELLRRSLEAGGMVVETLDVDLRGVREQDGVPCAVFGVTMRGQKDEMKGATAARAAVELSGEYAVRLVDGWEAELVMGGPRRITGTVDVNGQQVSFDSMGQMRMWVQSRYDLSTVGPPRALESLERNAPAQRVMYGARHVLVMYKGSRRALPTIERTKEEAFKRATEAMKKAKAKKSAFGDIAGEYSDEPTAAQRGGDLGKFPKGAMVPDFERALEKLKVGEVSDVVESPFGYHVILRTQ